MGLPRLPGAVHDYSEQGCALVVLSPMVPSANFVHKPFTSYGLRTRGGTPLGGVCRSLLGLMGAAICLHARGDVRAVFTRCGVRGEGRERRRPRAGRRVRGLLCEYMDRMSQI